VSQPQVAGSPPSRQRLAILIAIASFIGVALILHATTLGVDISGDSVTYLHAARNIIAGHGLTFILPDGSKSHLLVFPPLYPIMLATGWIARLDPITFARYLNCLALVATLTFTALLVARYTRSTWIIGLALLLCLSSRPLLFGYTRLMSEAPFVAFSFATLYFLTAYLQRPRRTFLILAAICIAAASLTRWAGISLVPVACAAIFLCRPRPLRARIIDAFLLILIITIAMEAWTIYNRQPASRPYGGRTLAFHPPSKIKLIAGARALSNWLAPHEVPASEWPVLALTVVVLVIPVIARRAGLPTAPLDLAAIFAISYIAFILISLTFFDAAIPLNSRIWMPLVPPLVILLAAAIAIPNRYRPIIALLLAFPILLNLYHTFRYANDVHHTGQGYLSVDWRNSELIAHLKKIPPKIPIASNAQDAIYTLLDRSAYGFPMARFRTIASDNPNLRADLIRLYTHDLGKKGLLVFSNRIKRGDFLPTKTRIEKYLTLEPVAELSDGQIYRITGIRKRTPATGPTTQP
jgi:hypothetical protein